MQKASAKKNNPANALLIITKPEEFRFSLQTSTTGGE